jgi:hypothetical protein
VAATDQIPLTELPHLGGQPTLPIAKEHQRIKIIICELGQTWNAQTLRQQRQPSMLPGDHKVGAIVVRIAEDSLATLKGTRRGIEINGNIHTRGDRQGDKCLITP